MKTPVLPGMFDVPTTVVMEAPKAPSEVVKELERLNAADLRVLAFLKLRGDAGVMNWEICTPEIGGLNGMARLRELRAHGRNISKEHIEGGTWRYTLHGLKGQ